MDFLKSFDLNRQIEQQIEPYRTKKSELADIAISEKVLHEVDAAYFSRAFFRLGLKTMQHSSDELQSAVTLLKQIFTINFFSKK